MHLGCSSAGVALYSAIVRPATWFPSMFRQTLGNAVSVVRCDLSAARLPAHLAAVIDGPLETPVAAIRCARLPVPFNVAVETGPVPLAQPGRSRRTGRQTRPLIWANRFAGKSPSFNGRRRPSRDGTSGMMRVYQVRICEGSG